MHNLRRAAVSNLAEADVTMEKIVEVTGQTPEIAREHYLKLSSEAQRETMEKLACLYGVTKEKDQDGEARSGGSLPSEKGEVEFKLSKKDAGVLVRHIERVFEGKVPVVGTGMGTKVGTTPNNCAVSPTISVVYGKMADREGVSIRNTHPLDNTERIEFPDSDISEESEILEVLEAIWRQHRTQVRKG